MKLIAHRGLYEGPSRQLENNPTQIAAAWDLGFDCEIDLRVIDNQLWLGHDGPEYKIQPGFLNKGPLWIHAKNLKALEYLRQETELNYFWHQDDDYTLTSKGYIWAYPGQKLPEHFGINVMPEWNDAKLQELNSDCYGICSDWVSTIKELLSNK